MIRKNDPIPKGLLVTSTIFFIVGILGTLLIPSRYIWTNSVQDMMDFDIKENSSEEINNIRFSTANDSYSERQPIYFQEFPHSINYWINLVFVGIDYYDVNTTYLLELLPKTSQISRYVPLSYEYETYINYSLQYNVLFLHLDESIEVINSLVSLGSFPFTLDMGLYWSTRTNESTYKRIMPTGAKWYLSNSKTLKLHNGQQYSLNPNVPTIFIGNGFFNGSQFYINQSYAPHTYTLEKKDHDTNLVSSQRNLGKFSPGFDWTDRSWVFLDLSAGPSSYQSVDDEFTNYFEYINGSISQSNWLSEIANIVKGITFSRFVPTFLYEPFWRPHIELGIALYHDSNFQAIDYLDLNLVKSAYENLFPFSNVTINFVDKIIEDGDETDNYLSYISSFTEYAVWAEKLVEFIHTKDHELFGSYNSENTLRLRCGIFATERISGNDENLGFTSGEIGLNRPLASVVTITPTTISIDHEGLTQTTIHELGHSFTLRHPHDYRFDGELNRLWIGDVCETPLSYFYSVYSFGVTDINTAFRGNYRYLFNSSRVVFDEILDLLVSKGFPANSYPRYIYENMLNVSLLFEDSLNDFISQKYEEGLKKVIDAFTNLTEICRNVSEMKPYFSPIVNFETINNSEVDYGDVIHLVGSLISYESPNMILCSEFRNYSIVSETNELELFTFESFFEKDISSILWGDDSDLIHMNFLVFDGTIDYHYTLVFKIHKIKVSIISPFDNQILDLSYSNSLKIYGRYYSVSNTSQLQILCGAYYYVEDRDQFNSTYWLTVNKSLGNEWIYTANISYFVNGLNLIKVKISNQNSSYIHSIRLQISGLKAIDSNTTSNPPSPSSSLPPTSTNASRLEPPYTLIVFGGLIGLTVLTISTRSIYNRRVVNKIAKKKIAPQFVNNQLSLLKSTVDKKMVLIDQNSIPHDTPEKDFKFKRRRIKY